VLFLYLNRHGYNGLCRYNLRGEFNVPFGRYKRPISRRLSCITLPKKRRTQSFIASPMKSVWNWQANSVVYCDPPYAPLSATANFTAYHTNSFSPAEQARLAEMAEKLVSKEFRC
jgi:DNA adenine methylase